MPKLENSVVEPSQHPVDEGVTGNRIEGFEGCLFGQFLQGGAQPVQHGFAAALEGIQRVDYQVFQQQQPFGSFPAQWRVCPQAMQVTF